MKCHIGDEMSKSESRVVEEEVEPLRSISG